MENQLSNLIAFIKSELSNDFEMKDNDNYIKYKHLNEDNDEEEEK